MVSRRQIRERRAAMTAQLIAERDLGWPDDPRAGEVVNLGPIADQVQRELTKQQRRRARSESFARHGDLE